MLSLSSQQMSYIQLKRNESWVDVHQEKLSHLLPGFVAMYPADEFRAMVIRMLYRADRRGLSGQDATVAFCFASIKLGVGFEDDPKHAWFADGLRGPQAGLANAIWDGLAAALDQTEEQLS